LDVELVILINTDFDLVFQDDIFEEITVIDELIDLQQVHALVFLLLFDYHGDLGEEVLELGGVDLLFVVVNLVEELVEGFGFVVEVFVEVLFDGLSFVIGEYGFDIIYFFLQWFSDGVAINFLVLAFLIFLHVAGYFFRDWIIITIFSFFIPDLHLSIHLQLILYILNHCYNYYFNLLRNIHGGPQSRDLEVVGNDRCKLGAGVMAIGC
jgi:hypothetical protein